MNKDDILKDFDTLAEAKRKGAVNLKLCLGFALVVVVLVLAWGLVVNFTALDKVVVVERSGEYLKTHAEDSEALFLALVKKTCAEATGYANSFDRLNLKKNQAHAAFYVNKNDLNAVFSKYYNDKAYFDAVQNGAVYKCEIDSIQTTVSVATEGGFFYSFNVTYADSLEHTNYFLPDMSSIRPDTIYLNEVSQTHLIAPEKVIYIDYGDTCIQVSKAENTENIVRMIAATGKVEEFPRQTNVSLATEGGKFYTFNVDYRQQPEAFVYEIGEKRPEKKANVILTDNIIPAGERDQVMSRVYNAKRGIFNKGIVRNKIVFSVNNLHIYDNLLLFTFEIENKSKLPYDIDYIRYYIIDKKTAKLTASQEVDQQALFSENYSPRIEGNGRMKYVIAFDKFTIPDEKVFRIEINEKNGGRHVLFDLENSDIVNVEDI